MASVTKSGEKSMAEDDTSTDAEATRKREAREDAALDYKSPGTPGGRGGFFTIYKRSQGYWTRMGTAGAASLILALVVYNLYQYLPTFGLQFRAVTVVSLVFASVFGLGIYWLMNKPSNAEFLIATDSEMKKVNWTSRKELIGSTKVVVVFMFLIAFILFVIDLFFQTFFYLINVLHVRPFFIKG